jgi:hypothetical protein
VTTFKTYNDAIEFKGKKTNKKRVASYMNVIFHLKLITKFVWLRDNHEFPFLIGIYYLIRAKTGTRTGAGTNANVFITLSGSGGSTRRINFGGRFESGDVDEIREFAKDIRPVRNIIFI